MTTVTTTSHEPSPTPGSLPRSTSVRWAVSDAAVLVGRSLRHVYRGIDALLLSFVLPIMMLLLFVYVFGGAIDVGTDYLNYVVPGIILLTAGWGASMTATTVTVDMTEGIVDRFRSLPMPAWAPITGHVVASMARNLVVTALVVGVALVMGFRPTAGPLEWLGVVGVLSLFVLAITWVSVVFGLLARTVEAASGFGFVVIFLPYVSSAFVPVDTMPAMLHGFAAHQPVTPIIETARALLLGTPLGNSAWLAVAWCLAILAVAVPASILAWRRRTAS